MRDLRCRASHRWAVFVGQIRLSFLHPPPRRRLALLFLSLTQISIIHMSISHTYKYRICIAMTSTDLLQITALDLHLQSLYSCGAIASRSSATTSPVITSSMPVAFDKCPEKVTKIKLWWGLPVYLRCFTFNPGHAPAH